MIRRGVVLPLWDIQALLQRLQVAATDRDPLLRTGDDLGTAVFQQLNFRHLIRINQVLPVAAQEGCFLFQRPHGQLCNASLLRTADMHAG